MGWRPELGEKARGGREAGKWDHSPELNRMGKQAEHEDSPAWLPTADAM